MARPKNAYLTAEKVIEAAIALIGEHGLEAFSMPKLAANLGVRALLRSITTSPTRTHF